MALNRAQQELLEKEIAKIERYYHRYFKQVLKAAQDAVTIEDPEYSVLKAFADVGVESFDVVYVRTKINQSTIEEWINTNQLFAKLIGDIRSGHNAKLQEMVGAMAKVGDKAAMNKMQKITFASKDVEENLDMRGQNNLDAIMGK